VFEQASFLTGSKALMFMTVWVVRARTTIPEQEGGKRKRSSKIKK
jgi:hypothetical protein